MSIVMDWLWKPFKWIMEGVWYLFKLVFDTIYESGLTMIEWIFDWTAPQTGVSGQDVLQWVEIGNYYFPIDHCYVAMSVSTYFLLGFAATKLFVKMIPGIG